MRQRHFKFQNDLLPIFARFRPPSSLHARFKNASALPCIQSVVNLALGIIHVAVSSGLIRRRRRSRSRFLGMINVPAQRTQHPKMISPEPFLPLPLILPPLQARSQISAHLLAVQTSSEHLPSLLLAHHSALRLIHTLSLFSPSRSLMDRQNLKSLNFGVQSLKDP